MAPVSIVVADSPESARMDKKKGKTLSISWFLASAFLARTSLVLRLMNSTCFWLTVTEQVTVFTGAGSFFFLKLFLVCCLSLLNWMPRSYGRERKERNKGEQYVAYGCVAFVSSRAVMQAEVRVFNCVLIQCWTCLPCCVVNFYRRWNTSICFWPTPK